MSAHPHPKTRGERRAAATRRQAAATRYYRRVNAHLAELMPYHCAGGIVPDAEAISQQEGRKYRDIRKPCSCPFCKGYVTRTPTIQERREPPLLLDAHASPQ